MAIFIPALLIAITLTGIGTVTAAQMGLLEFVGIGPNDNNTPTINGTILNNDNQTFGILIVPKNGTVTIPTPPPVVTPPVNNTPDNDTIPNPPPVVNNTPPAPVNKPPVVTVDSPIKCVVNTDCTMTSKSIDPEGKLTEIIWNQEDGPQVSFTNSQDRWTATFKPLVGGTYVFSVEAQDDKGLATLKSITVNVPVPTPVPTPAGQTIKVAIVADIEDSDAGTKVFYSIKLGNYSNVFVLGDLGYGDNLAWFKSTYGSLGNKVNCVLGNHDATENGGTSIQAEAIKYCANSWYIKKNSVLFLGFNTNGDLTTQANEGGKLLQNKDFMNGIKSVHILTHKSCAVPPNSHHPVETKAFCDIIKSKIPSTVKAYFDSGHNHVLSESADKTYKQSGAGGRSHYSCGVSTAFPYCDNVHYGYLEYVIKPDGTTTSSFKDYNGKVIHQ